MMKRWQRLLLILCAAAPGTGGWAQASQTASPTAPSTTPSQTQSGAQTQPATAQPAWLSSALAQAAPPVPGAPQQKPAEKPKKISRHDRHEAEKSFREGTDAIVKNDPATAQKDFARAHELDPGDKRYPLSTEVARQFVITQMVQKAVKAKLLGHADEARSTLAEALKLDPGNTMVMQHIGELADEARAAQPEIAENEGDLAAPIALAPVKAQRSFHVRTDEQSLLRLVLNGYGIQATLDPSVKSQTVRFDADDVDFAQAANMVKLATNTFFVPLDPIHVVVAADTKENRTKYERQVMETIYFPGMSAEELTEMGNVARNIYGAEHGQVQASHNTMMIRAPEPTLAALNQTYTELLAGRSEVMLEVYLYEVDRSHEKNIGVMLPNSTMVFNVPSELNSVISSNSSLIQQVIASGLANAGDTDAIVAALIAAGALSGTVFNSPFGVFGGGLTLTGVEVNSATANLLLNTSMAESIDQVELRAEDQQEATLKTGEKYPIITSSFSSLTPTSSLGGLGGAASSLLSGLGLGSSASAANQTIPQVQYQDLGLTLKIKPHVESEKELGLNVNLELDSLQGSMINDIPVLNNRQYTGFVSLRPGDSALIMSAISKMESHDITGIPGLGDIPGLGGTTNSDDTVDTTELVIVITPHIVRIAHREVAGKMMLLPQHP
jgi:general secretion pathway protein D